MKKLLGLLAAFGLTASAGSAVVACGDPKPSDTNVVDVKLKVTLKEGKNEKDVKPKIEELKITAEGSEADKVKNSQANAISKVKAVDGVASAEIDSSKAASTFSVTVKVTYTVKVEKKDIKDIKPVIKAGMDKATTESVIHAAITAIAKDAVLTTDYTISGWKADMKAGDKIEVKSVSDSKHITGNVTITVVEADKVKPNKE